METKSGSPSSSRNDAESERDVSSSRFRQVPFSIGFNYECGRVVGFSMASVGDSGTRATEVL